MADDDTFDSGSASALNSALDGVQARTANLAVSANGFASAMSRAFNQSAIQGRQFDDVLKSLALRLSSMVVTQAFRPLAASLTGSLNQLFSGLFGGGSAAGSVTAGALGMIKPFAAGGVIGTPTYFPLTGGGMGLAGEAGPEAILPLARGADGRLGVTAGVAGVTSINIHIATPDADSFRRSESYITGQIARAVARGQRSL